MNKWETTIKIFNSKVSGKVFTRNEIIMLFKEHGINYNMGNSCMTYVNTLLRAGFLSNEEHGVYRKIRKIPKLSEKAMKKMIQDKKHDIDRI